MPVNNEKISVNILKDDDSKCEVLAELIEGMSNDISFDDFMKIARNVFSEYRVDEDDASNTPCISEANQQYIPIIEEHFLLKAILIDFPTILFNANEQTSSGVRNVEKSKILKYLHGVINFIEDLFKNTDDKRHETFFWFISSFFSLIEQKHRTFLDEGDKSLLPVLEAIRRNLLVLFRLDNVSIPALYSIREHKILRLNLGEHVVMRDLCTFFFGHKPLTASPNPKYRLVEAVDEIAKAKFDRIVTENNGDIPDELASWEHYLIDRKKVSNVPQSTSKDQRCRRPRESSAEKQPLAFYKDDVIFLEQSVTQFGQRIKALYDSQQGTLPYNSSFIKTRKIMSFHNDNIDLQSCFDEEGKPISQLRDDIIMLFKMGISELKLGQEGSESIAVDDITMSISLVVNNYEFDITHDHLKLQPMSLKNEFKRQMRNLRDQQRSLTHRSEGTS